MKIVLHDKSMKWFPGVNSLMTSGSNTEGTSFAQNTYVTKYNYVIIIIKKKTIAVSCICDTWYMPIRIFFDISHFFA